MGNITAQHRLRREKRPMIGSIPPLRVGPCVGPPMPAPLKEHLNYWRLGMGDRRGPQPGIGVAVLANASHDVSCERVA